jgi:hypothetical protein
MPDRPEPLTDSIARFTPSAPGLDRDAILFAAGRRAARGSWVWKGLTAVLAASQAVTLLALWPKGPPPAVPVAPAPVTTPVAEPTPPAASPVPADVWTAGSRPDVLQSPPAPTGIEFVTSGPPLTARSNLRFD